MTINPDQTFLDANRDGTPGTGSTGTYGPLRLRNLFFALRSTQILNDITLTAPPGGPVEGASYLVAPTGTGAWAGRDNQIATYINGGWVFSAPQVGVAYGLATTGAIYSWNGSAMSQVGAGSALDLEGLYDAVAYATAAEIAALDGDETVLVEIDDGTLRQVLISDLPVAGKHFKTGTDSAASIAAAPVGSTLTDVAGDGSHYVRVNDGTNNVWVQISASGGGSNAAAGDNPFSAGQTASGWVTTKAQGASVTLPAGPTASGYWVSHFYFNSTNPFSLTVSSGEIVQEQATIMHAQSDNWEATVIAEAGSSVSGNFALTFNWVPC